MTHEYKHYIDLSMFSPSYGFPEPLDPAKSSNRILAYARELDDRNKQLEARIEKMQAAGDALVSWIPDSNDAQHGALEAWRNA